ncbi:hypothetical protein COCOBI_04-5350 [Coccomyxa sp. Obi]|nr:hypothetical protein COCOBI_04-5350 [Coccomyxa sp. Obi]
MADVKLPVVRSRDTQELSVQKADGIPKRLNVFKRNAELARAVNAEYYPIQGVALDDSADMVPWDQERGGVLPGPYPGKYPHTLPDKFLAEELCRQDREGP